jgi:adhesin transport system membrane fusion protein
MRALNKLPLIHITSKHTILWAIAILCVMFFIWASLTVIEEVTRGEGKVIPSSKVQVIQNLEGGIVKNILVDEGETVRRGQILMELSDIRFGSEYRVNLLEQEALAVKVARLQAEVTGKEFVPEAALREKMPRIIRHEQALFQSRQDEMDYLQQQLNLLQSEIDMTKPLIGTGAVSKVELLRLQQKQNELKGKVKAFHSTALSELTQALDELAQIKEKASTLKDRLERTAVKSPVDGIVKQIYVNTLGGVIQEGSPMMEIVPLEDTLRVEVRIRPKDIGFIHFNQPAKVKITAYDFTVYGGLQGKVEHISADTTTDEQGDSYYEVWVRTEKAYLGSEDDKLAIIPGMQASVSILTGKKTVLKYLLKPVIRAKAEALRER